ncbi:DUF6252 family protein [uncultured Aquimarina sp.]|uniref:DUF6252 family protein n=1 Tax=uncultured Aquimarina sp. TaxID=575652 RepID=UPI002609D95C|nr:DUF6252 family protein [uncultured Aquimarina sp.]
MKIKFILFITITILTFVSCSSDDSSPENSNYAMTAKINGEDFQANNPFGNNEPSSTTIFNYFPKEDFVLLIGREGGVIGGKEIKIWLKKSDIIVGSYETGPETFDTTPSHFIDFLDLTNEIDESTKNGTIEITEVNTSTNTVTGTFSFTTVDGTSDPSSPIDFNITDGTFKYIYE